MYKINNTYYDLILEDEEIVVLENSVTGEPLTMTRNEFWARCEF